MRSRRADILDERRKVIGHRAARRAEPRPCSRQRGLEPIPGERFQQVVHCMNVEGAQRVAIERGDEDDARQLVRGQRQDHFEAVELRHLDVEEDEVWLVGDDGLQRGGAIAALADEHDVALGREQTTDAAPRHRLVIDDQGAERHDAAAIGLNGISIETLAPPPGALASSSRCDAG
jgi:hypothetical protein